MEGRFDYLLERIRDADFEADPFPHLYLTDFLSEADFKSVTSAPDVDLPVSADVDTLFARLDGAGYEPIVFPGCTTNRAEYQKWLARSSKPRKTHPACEGQGMAFRLTSPVDDTVRELNDCFASTEMTTLLREKFAITRSTYLEAGVQKYLHGYEISPHPDIRKKALTWMLNINPGADSEAMEFHTHYLQMNADRSYVVELWRTNPNLDTCWVPWDWCTTVKRQRENNSIVIFAPRWDTIHGIKAHYDHLPAQRTQFYGNLWYDTTDPPTRAVVPDHKRLDFQADPTALAELKLRAREKAWALKTKITR